MVSKPWGQVRALLEDWQIDLRAQRKSPDTLKAYVSGVEQYLAWADATGHGPEIDRRGVKAFTTSLLEAGRKPATVASRQLALRRFTAWLTDEEVLDDDPLRGIKPVKIDVPVIQPLSEDQLRTLIKSAHDEKSFRGKRDEALIRLMAETGLRASEAVDLHVSDVNYKELTIVVRRGKGGKGRVVPFSAQTASAMTRYRRAAAGHRLADTDTFWLGDRGKAFTYQALYKALKRRAEAVGITDFHPHRLRNTAADRWLSAGGSETGLMAVAGWSRPDMLNRYTRARASERAIEESRGLNLGDI